MKQQLKQVTRGCLLALLGMGLVGCGGSGPSLKPVAGTVTLDGQPLANARVVFEPDEGRASIGETDASGKYEARYTGTRTGVLPGKQTIRISTYRLADPDSGIETNQAETVPAKYNIQSTLEVDIPADTYDFALDSQGPIIQPHQESGGRRRSTD
ncbi:MAG: carboxypeptidase-like regulatory domain-containing protein [Pirellulaceae bacterium]